MDLRKIALDTKALEEGKEVDIYGNIFVIRYAHHTTAINLTLELLKKYDKTDISDMVDHPKEKEFYALHFVTVMLVGWRDLYMGDKEFKFNKTNALSLYNNPEYAHVINTLRNKASEVSTFFADTPTKIAKK